MTILDEALRWLEMGITPIPLVYRSKQPVVAWGEWKDKQPPVALVKGWFCGLRNIAIILAGDLIVLDFDIVGYYIRWKIAHPTVAQTYTVKSNRGCHVYLRIDEPVKTSAMEGGEVLAAGHQLTVPPSVHKSGNAYHAIGGKDILRIGSISEIDIIPIEIEKTDTVTADSSAERSPVVWLPTGTIGDNNHPIKTIKQAVDISSLFQRLGLSIAIAGSAKSIVTNCPFHEDSTPSFQVWFSSNRAQCHAPGCRAHRNMDVIDIAALYWNVSNKTAINMLMGMCV